MINFRKGCKVPFPERIFEEYEQIEHGYVANVSAEKIVEVLKDFVYMLDDPVFFFLELPTNFDGEPKNENNEVNELHKDIYCIGNLTKEKAISLLDSTGELLVNDGLCQFGFGSQSSHDEIMFGKYNVTTICCKENNPYSSLFYKYNINKTENIVTAWETFSKEFPGECEKAELNGKDVYSILDDYKSLGLRFVERRVDE